MKYKVAVIKKSEQFADCVNDEKNPTGITIDIWKEVAYKYNIDYEFICLDKTYNQIVEDVSNGLYDIGLGDFSVIKKRISKINYSRPFYISKLYIHRKQNSLLKSFINNDIIRNILIIALIIIIFFSILRKLIIGENIFLSLYETLTSFFYGHKDFIEFKNSKNISIITLINTLWTIIRYIFLTIIIAKAISIFMNINDNIKEDELNDIKNVNVLKETSFVDYIKLLEKNSTINNSRKEMIDKIFNSNGNFYILDDINIINNEIKKSSYKLELARTIDPVLNDEYALIVNKKYTELLNQIDTIILELQDSGKMIKICKGYLNNDKDIQNCIL
jgi:ABC-type amino acid transport substrate-binding protein